MTHEEFQRLTQVGPVLLDGATGSNLRKAGLPVGACTEAWLLEHPETILALQRAYVDAGTQILYAPTFSANRVTLTMYGMENRLVELNREMVSLARQAADGRAWVAGDLTTTGKSATMSYPELLEIYQEQISALVEAGVDLLVAETMLTVDETLAALDAAQSVCALPMMCSLTVEADGSLLYGGSVADAALALQEMGAAAVGLNCSVGPDQLESVVGAMVDAVSIPVIAKPNAGMPVMDERGCAHYSMSPERFAESMLRLVDRGARLIGGCCGTDPEFIARLSDRLAQA